MNLKLVGLALGTASFWLSINTALAAPLVNFSNGTVADANDVNANFNELATRIDEQGNSSYSWAGYGNSAWSRKVFIRKDSSNGFDKEERIFERSPTSATTGTTVMTRIRTDSSANRTAKYQKLTFNYDTQGVLLFSGVDNYTSDGLSLVSQMRITPGVNLRNNAMILGVTWASAAQTDTTYVDGSAATQSYTVDSNSLLAVESITVQSVTYDNCHKILTNRSGATMGNHFQQISWFCPNNVGLVKYIRTRDIGSTVGYQVLEFDPDQSTLTPTP